MKFQGIFLAALTLLIGLSFSGCEKEMIEPDTNSSFAPALRGGTGHFRPDQQCGSSRMGELTDGSGSFGTVEILNDASEIYMLLDMNPNYFIDAIYVYYGTNAGIPTNSVGEMLTEDFQFQAAVNGGAARYTVTYPTASLPACTDLVAVVMVSEKNLFGNTIANHALWLDGTAIYNGYSFKYCIDPCNP